MPPKQTAKKPQQSNEDQTTSQTNISLNDIAAKLDSMEARFDQLPAKVSEEVSLRIEEVVNKITKCEEKINHIEKSTNSKLHNLEIENNVLRRQLNRADIIISGVPSMLTSADLYTCVKKVGVKYGVDISEGDINTCNWIYNKKSVLVKFNQQLIKYTIMSEYFKTKDLKLSDIYDKANDVESRIFLNHNLTPHASKLHYICQKLRRAGLEMPKAVVNLNNDEVKTLSLEQLSLFLKKVEQVVSINKDIMENAETISEIEI
ncbi:hypothetical protein CVS40_12851 [Lucilia cuprina]|nr:hypothetical protein CVS40_12851 [Lucilia cuprina]